MQDGAQRPVSEPRDVPGLATPEGEEPTSGDPSALNIESGGDRRRGDIWKRVREGLVLADVRRPNRAAPPRGPGLRQPFVDQIVERATPYLHHIVEEAERRDMPTDVALLPIVESAYRAEARSPGHAAGIWQLIPSTGRHLGLEQSAWYDGWRDVLASTDAALDYLEALHERFDGDWLNAFAAYNCGEGMVERAIARNRRAGRGTDFWSLALPTETRGFVPKLIAVSKIVANPAGHKLSLRPIPDKPYLAEVEVGRQIRLTEAAKLAGVSVEEMRRLNPGLIQSITAPSGPHRLAVPVDRAPAFRRRLAGHSHVKIRGGPQHPANTPPPTRRAVSLGQRVDNRRLAVMSVPGWFGGTTHRVRAGDTLWDISQTYRVPLAALCEANGLGAKAAGINTRLRPGQDLLIPSPAALGAETSVDRKPPTHHRIQPGDSLPSIARRYRVSVNQLRRWNRPAAFRSMNPGSVLVVYRSPRPV
ncbi:MAG: transglycosylase SLT domain-containing protein [Pseudomonadota bacterium]|nr:transglycosylase SLT domain-containing protein [Pseudomonadota bacterium]